MSAVPINANPSGHLLTEDSVSPGAEPSGLVGLAPSQVLESLAAAMSGLTVEEYRKQSKMAREGYARIVQMACEIRKEREDK